MLKICTLFSLLLLSFFVTATQKETIKLWHKNWNPNNIALLSLLFDSTAEEYGKVQLKLAKPMEQGRALLQLEQNKDIDLLWFATNPEREKKLIPIRIPVAKGLLGHRVCLIRKGQQHKFDNINTLADWQASSLTIGQGTHWPDTKILESNKLSVVSSVKYHSLFNMLQKQRFDCFARAIIEVKDELALSGNEDLELEKRLLFIYRMPEYIFVSRKNPKLAQRLHLGFKRIIENGQFEQFLQGHRYNKAKGLKLNQRKVIYLNNPDLTTETRLLLDDKSLWFDYKQL